GHAHRGTFEGFVGAVPVYNVAVHVTQRDFWIFELEPGTRAPAVESAAPAERRAEERRPWRNRRAFVTLLLHMEATKLARIRVGQLVPPMGVTRARVRARLTLDRLLGPGRSVPDDLDDPAAVPLAVELEEEHALPRAESELAVAHRDRLARGAEQQRHAVRV